MNRFLSLLVTCCVFFISLSGCGKPDLTRDLAAELIQANPALEAHKKYVLLHKDALKIGQSMGWWTVQWSGPFFGPDNRMPDEFSEFISGDNAGIEPRNIRIIAKSPVRISINVTGVAQNTEKSTAIVDFDWKYSSLPARVNQVAVDGGKGQASFQLYDDGWRFVRLIGMSSDLTPYQMSDSEKAALAQELQATKQRKLDEKNQAAHARAKALAEAEKLFVGAWRTKEGVVCEYTAKFSFICSANELKWTGTWSIQGENLVIQTRQRTSLGEFRDYALTSIFRINEIAERRYSIQEKGRIFVADRIN